MIPKTIEQNILKWRRELHRIPEIGLCLPNTSAYLRRVLDEAGIPYRLFLNGNGLVAEVCGRERGPVVMIRADMDGLQIQEESGLPFASENGNMHACGHDSHMSMALGAAVYLNAAPDFAGTVRFLFQPGEEYPGGAAPMIREGALEGVDAILALHAGWMSKEMPRGSIGFKEGAIMASMDRFLLTVKGRGGHGAAPERTTDPIVTAAEIVLALQRLSSREVKASEPVIVSVCRISGGMNQNIIPDRVELEGTVRALREETRTFIRRRLEEIAGHIAGAYGNSVEMLYEDKYPPVINDGKILSLARSAAAGIYSDEEIFTMTEPVMGGEDFAFYLEKIPGAMIFLANPKEVGGKIYPHHHARFDLDESAFAKGAEFLARFARRYLQMRQPG